MGRSESPVIHPQEPFLKGGFLTPGLPAALGYSGHELPGPSFLGGRGRRGSLGRRRVPGLILWEQKGLGAGRADRPLETPPGVLMKDGAPGALGTRCRPFPTGCAGLCTPSWAALALPLGPH